MEVGARGAAEENTAPELPYERTKAQRGKERGGGGVWKRRSGLMCHLQAKWQTD